MLTIINEAVFLVNSTRLSKKEVLKNVEEHQNFQTILLFKNYGQNLIQN